MELKDTSKIRFKIEFENQYHNIYKMESKVDIYPDLGNDEINELAGQINNFMRQIGYSSFNKDKIFLESVTEEEYEYLLNCLDEYREDKKNNN